jgi:hypothetical protein
VTTRVTPFRGSLDPIEQWRPRHELSNPVLARGRRQQDEGLVPRHRYQLVAHLVSYLAKKSDRPYRTLLRQLLRLLALDVERGERAWMFRLVAGGHWAVNESELRRLHPELFERRYVTREEHEDHEKRLSDLEKSDREAKKYSKATGGRVSRLERQLNLLPIEVETFPRA